ncbi:MAG TPA: DUF5317 domain-containing protein [Acidimicrobiia bacterium]
MLWLALVLFLALATAMLRGGRLTNLGDIEMKAWWLLVVGFGLQAATRFLPDTAWAETAGLIMVLGSFFLLMILVVVNRNRPGMWLAGVGVLMNFTVISLNGGMPVLAEAAQVASGFTESTPDIVGSFKHVVMDETTLLTAFADVIPIRMAGHGQVISLGDVFLAVGLGRFLEYELRKPRRYFKHGAQAEAGSAH